jgi:ubiquinone/menaquinone biosynthesis C-methylase UbiE
MKQGLVLDKVVLLGRTFEEYTRFFALADSDLAGRSILDVAAGVSSFRAEAAGRGLDVTAFDRIYAMTPEQIQAHCEPDLARVVEGMASLKTYRWEFYQTPEGMRAYRERAYRTFLEDYPSQRGTRYLAGNLPHLPFPDRHFDLTLASYLLFVYADQFDYAFHQASVREVMRVTRDEARFYPLVTLEAQRCAYVDRLAADPALSHLTFEEVRTDFEFLANSNWFLRVRHLRSG